MIDPKLSSDQLLVFGEKLQQAVENSANLGCIGLNPTPRTTVYKEDKLTLYRYDTETISTVTTPLLIVYALVNRPYMMDLEPGRSLIANLLQEGVQPYLIDWGYPDSGDQFLSMDDYIFGYLDNALEYILKQHGIQRLNLMGVCQGGVFSLCYAAAHSQKVSNLITMVTPVDFHTGDNLLSQWIQQVDVKAMVDALGNVPGSLLNWTFLSMKPFQLGVRKYLDMIENADDETRLLTFMRMEQWINDSPDQAGLAFAEFVEWFFINNSLVSDDLRIGTRPVSLKSITQPVLNVIASQDHLVPPSASRPLKSLLASTDYTEHTVNAGHIGLFVGTRTGNEVASRISQWLQEREK